MAISVKSTARVGPGSVSGPYGRTTYSKSPEAEGEEAARKKIAYANALQKESDRKSEAAARTKHVLNAAAAGVDKRGLPGYDPMTGTVDPAKAHQAVSGMSREQWNDTRGRIGRQASFQARDQFGGFKEPAPLPATATPGGGLPDSGVTIAPTGVTQRNAAGGVTVDSQYGGGSSRIVKPTELVQPYFANDKGDQTHTVLSKTPGEDPNLDPIYAAQVFRKAGDEKTALAYEKHAGTLDPSKYVGPGGAPWANPHYATATPVTPAAATTVAAPRTGSPLDVLSGIQPANFSTETGGRETYGGRPADLSLSSDRPAFPSSAFEAGESARRFAGNVVDAFTPRPGTLPVGSFQAAKTGGVGPSAPGRDILASTTDFFRGASTPAGASRAEAADFQVPTKAYPLPVTPTTPRSAIAAFGGFNEPPPPPPPPPKEEEET